MPPATLSRLLEVVGSPRAVDDLAAYFEPGRPADAPPRFPGSRFEFLVGGGTRPETANRITADDLVAVTLLSTAVPGNVAQQLLEGDLGRDIAWHLESVPVDVGIENPAAAELFSTASSVRLVRDLLQEPHGIDWFTAQTLLARKRPRLVPVHDRVARCLTGLPDESMGWHLDVFAADAGLADRLSATRRSARVPEEVSVLRVLDVILWMRHAPVHLENGCPGLI